MNSIQIELSGERLAHARRFAKEYCEALRTNFADRLSHRMLEASKGVLLVYEGIDLPPPLAFQYGASYCGGKALHEVTTAAPQWPSATNRLLLSLVHSHFQAAPDGVIVFDDLFHDAPPSELKKGIAPHIRKDRDGSYLLLTPADTDAEVVSDILAEANAFHTLGVCTRVSGSLRSDDEPGFLGHVVGNAANVIVGIYDGEGFLVVWL
jgi:hypothetical protein